MKISNLKRLVLKIIHYLGLGIGLNRNFVSVLCYHSISNSADKYSVSLPNFKKQIGAISRYANFIGGKELGKTLTGKKINDWGMVLTIDDGYKDVKKIVPLAKKFNIPVILFVLSSANRANRKEIANNHKLLTFVEIKKLHKLGWIIGCHSATHADLSKLTDPELVDEIINSKKTLEKRLGFKINYFAYPKGIVNGRILKYVKKAGYKLAFTTRSGVINSATNPLLLPRTVIDKSKSLNDFPYFLSESGLFLNQVFENFGVWKILSIVK